MSRNLPEEIYVASRQAVKAAQLEHHSALNSALYQRGRLIAELFGLDPDEKLPNFDQNLVSDRVKKITSRHKDTFDRVKELDVLLHKALDAQSQRLNHQNGELGRSNLLAKSMRSTLYRSNSRRLDING